jgi:hypothetical protein
VQGARQNLRELKIEGIELGRSVNLLRLGNGPIVGKALEASVAVLAPNAVHCGQALWRNDKKERVVDKTTHPTIGGKPEDKPRTWLWSERNPQPYREA